MRIVTFDVASIDDVKERTRQAFKGKKVGTYRSFVSLDLMHRMLTPNRWGILRALLGAGPLGIRELARRLDRDAKNVHTDVQALAKAGVIDRADGGKVVFPYDAVHVDFTVSAVDAA